MPETDHPLKRLVALAADDFASWILQQPIQSVTLHTSELLANAEPIDADQLLLVTLTDGRRILLHIEFQGPGSRRPMSLRMLEYISRLTLLYRDLIIHSVVIYLARAGATDTGIHQINGLDGQPRLIWRYDVIRLWQMRGEDLLALQRPGLLALLGQTKIEYPEQTIPAALQLIGKSGDTEQRERLLSELLLLCNDREIAAMIKKLYTRDYGLPETPIMRELRQEGWEQGLEQGREQGLEAVVLRQLQRRFGPLSESRLTQIQQLGSTKLLVLAEALLEFRTTKDLDVWFAQDQQS